VLRSWMKPWLLLVVFAVAASWAAAQEPVQDGKPLSEWRKLLKNKDWEERNKAALAISAIGKEARAAVSELLAVIKADKSIDVRRAAVEAVGSICADLEGKGGEVKAALPVLVAVLTDTKAPDKENAVRTQAVGALGRVASKEPAVAKEVVPHLVGMFKDSDPYVRSEAADSLYLCGAAAKLAVPDLIKALKDPEERVRDSAGKALKEIDPEAAKKAGVR
jgi:HEAT repeat protein